MSYPQKNCNYRIDDNDPNLSQRFHTEKPASRPAFHRDRDRLIHSAAFRRLMDKTQVLLPPRLDHYRTRLSHSLEVAQIARSISWQLGMNETLTEVIALAHDIGHPPFGHAGEKCLNELMEEHEQHYDHNIHAINIVCDLEKRYFAFQGLNLTFATLDGIFKHGFAAKGHNEDKCRTIKEHFPSLVERMHARDIALEDAPSLEAQIAGISDDIAYTAHDIDDALRAETLKEDDLEKIPMVCAIYQNICEKYPRKEHHLKYRECLGNEIASAMIKKHVENIFIQTNTYFETIEKGLNNAHSLRKNKQYPITFSPKFQKEHECMKEKLYDKILPFKKEQERKAKRVINVLFEYYMEECPKSDNKVRDIVRHIAGMTDGYAYKECKKILFS